MLPVTVKYDIKLAVIYIDMYFHFIASSNDNKNETEPAVPGNVVLEGLSCDIHFTDDLIIPDFLSSKSIEPDPGGESFEDLFERFASMRGMWLLVSVCVSSIIVSS